MLQLSKIQKFTKIALIILIAVFAAWLLDKNFTPRGKLTLSYNFDRQKTPFLKFTGLSESEKTLSEKRWYRKALTSPIKIKLDLPRPYKKAKIYLEYQNTAFPVVYLAGIQKTKNLSGEEIKAIENKILDNITWYRLEDKNRNIVLLQKGEDKCKKEVKNNMSNFFHSRGKKQTEENLAYEECLYKYSKDKSPDELHALGNQEKKPWREYQFENIDDFLNNVSQVIHDQKIAYFNFDLLSHLKIENYNTPNNTPTGVTPTKTFDKSLRGKHQILTYIKNEPLAFTFYFQDLNRKSGKDPFGVLVKQGNKVFARKDLPDDKNISGNYKKSNEQELNLNTKNLAEGFYELELNAGSDIVINKIQTKQIWFAFKNHLNLFNPNQNIEFYTRAPKITFSPKHKTGLGQEIKIESQDSESISIPKLGLQEKIIPPSTPFAIALNQITNYTVNLSGNKKITTQKNDLVINFDGLAYLQKDFFENFNFQNIPSFLRPDILQNPENADYIITSYSSPPKKISKSWMSQEVEFDLTELGLNPFKPKASLFLHIPGFDRNRGDFKLRKIRVTLEKNPWDFEYLKNVIKSRLKK